MYRFPFDFHFGSVLRSYIKLVRVRVHNCRYSVFAAEQTDDKSPGEDGPERVWRAVMSRANVSATFGQFVLRGVYVVDVGTDVGHGASGPYIIRVSFKKQVALGYVFFQVDIFLWNFVVIRFFLMYSWKMHFKAKSKQSVFNGVFSQQSLCRHTAVTICWSDVDIHHITWRNVHVEG